MDYKKKQQYFVQSIAKGLAALESFAEAGHPLTLSELAQALGINNTTATRLCYTLTELGFIRRNGQRRYHLTPRVLTLGYSTIRGLDWREIAHYYLELLCKKVGETVNLSILVGQEILYVLRIKTERILPFDLQVGSTLPVYCTSMGKVFMAFSPPERTRPILEKLQFRPLTHRTISRMEDYFKELEQVKRKGYAINDEELSVGLRSVAAPIRDTHGWAIAAINIAVPTKRFSLNDAEKVLVPRVIETAELRKGNIHT